MSIKDTILSKLSETNTNIINNNGFIQEIFLNESKGNQISLSNLQYHLNHNLDLNVDFQRESTDHKGNVPQQIVFDYISGQFMGNITCYKNPRQNKKEVIDGKHRLTHLSDFLNGKLVLKDKSAARFWTRFIDEIITLYNSNGNTYINNIVKKLENGKTPPVDFTKLPKILQYTVFSGVEIHTTDIEIKTKDMNGNFVDVSEDIADTVLFEKFTRINQNSANITPDDAIWGGSGDYNNFSKNLCKNDFFVKMFKIPNDKDKDKSFRTLNTLIFTQQLFVDELFKWGSGTKSISKKIFDFGTYEENSIAEKEYTKILSQQIINNFNNYFKTGVIELPDELTGLKNNLTNIRYFMYFLYRIHLQNNNDNKYNFYVDDGSGDKNIPSQQLIAFIKIASKIISASLAGKDEVALNIIPTRKDHNIYVYNLEKLYVQDSFVFEKLDEYRKNQRATSDIKILFDRLIDLCYYAYENGMI